MTDSFAKICIAVALLCATACGAFTAWRMSVVDDSMGDALNAAVHALITDSSARIRAANDVSDHLRSYADYVAASYARDISLMQADESSDDATKQFYLEQSEVDAIPATIAKNYFPQRFVKRDGEFNRTADYRSTIAKYVGKRKIDASTIYADSQLSRDKTDRLVVILLLYAITILVVSCSELIESPKANFGIAVAGVLASLIGIVLTVMIEAGKLI
ncbi:MAG: hypothetical protein NT020_12915 [Chloroflexales bacterium]|nr:hypothetical protein [Chloroflexales bacterium]